MEQDRVSLVTRALGPRLFRQGRVWAPGEVTGRVPFGRLICVLSQDASKGLTRPS